MSKIEKHGNLKFRNGQFILEEVSDSKTRMKLYKDPQWTDIGNDSYTTQDLGAVLKYREWGDAKTTKILKKRFQAFYGLSPTIEFPQGLDDHQVQGLHWILTRKRSYLAHAPGAGKTAQAILAACYTEGRGQALFIVPPSLTKNWEREIVKFAEWGARWPDIGIVRGAGREIETHWGADFLICPDSLLTKPRVVENLRRQHFKFIAVDEASRFKTATAQRSLAFYGGTDSENRSFTPLYRKARHVVFLDGSPMPNRPMELWAPTYALDPESIDGMGMDAFGHRYCGARPNERGQWEFLFSSNEEELRARLQKTFMHVVSENELDHPERRRAMLFLSHDPRTREHREWERRNLGDFQFAEESSRGEIARFRRELGIRKVPYVAQYVRERLDEKGESLLVFAWHRDVVDDLTTELGKYGPRVVMGGTPEKAREAARKDFQSGKTRLLIANIGTMGRGHNLQKADRVVFAEWSWTDELNKQCEKRASRKGSDKDFVRCDYLVAPNSMDEKQLQAVFAKERRVKKVIG